MDPLDKPIQLTFNNGNNFPTNFVFIAYAIMICSIGIAVIESYILGAILTIITLFPITNRNIVAIDSRSGTIHDYSLYFGFIKFGGKYPLDKYKYITNMPLVQSNQMYASSSNSTTISDSYFTVTMFGERLKGKRIITKFESKNQAEEQARKLASRLGLKYFEYDPKLVRKILLGQATL